jgi:hypothetical protein
MVRSLGRKPRNKLEFIRSKLQPRIKNRFGYISAGDASYDNADRYPGASDARLSMVNCRVDNNSLLPVNLETLTPTAIATSEATKQSRGTARLLIEIALSMRSPQ